MDDQEPAEQGGHRRSSRYRAEAEALMGLDETPLPEFEAEGDSGQE